MGFAAERSFEMLKTATILAIVGASLNLILALLNAAARFSGPMRMFLGSAPWISFFYVLIPAAYLFFFIALLAKQK
jgi:hypothetical protein